MATTGGRKVSRRKVTLLWVVVMAAIIITLIYLERADLLYVLATLGVTALLVVVALADLSGARKQSNAPAPADDAAALGSGLATTIASPTTPSRARANRAR